MKSEFPSYKQTAKLGELGVSIVSRVISDYFGWLFKRNHQEHDFGIDGQVELVTELGAVTGQMFAVQIKCGKSFLSEKNKWGYVYRGEAKHFNYLANYPIPIIVCLCDPDTSQCYWVQFKPELTQATGEGWKLTVPFENTLSTSKSQLLSIVPPVRDAASELQSYWEFNNMLTEAGTILYALDEHDIKNRELALPRAFFDRLKSTRELAHACQGKVELMFSGYDDDPRELFEIQEVREYVIFLDHVLTDLFFFVRTEKPTYSLMTFALCQTDVEWVDGRSTKAETKKVSFDARPIADFLHRHWSGLNELTDWLDMPVEANKRITFAVVRCLGLEPPIDEDGA
jgi:hypothetical protein